LVHILCPVWLLPSRLLRLLCQTVDVLPKKRNRNRNKVRVSFTHIQIRFLKNSYPSDLEIILLEIQRSLETSFYYLVLSSASLQTCINLIVGRSGLNRIFFEGYWLQMKNYSRDDRNLEPDVFPFHFSRSPLALSLFHVVTLGLLSSGTSLCSSEDRILHDPCAKH